ncbi:uncharacterized protein LOC110862662 isoform X2 [Folsomia candida]|uniref:uncharacterized protein LOC110862662 isoform X2 n=1 Tax=Folsomia candida TaxID=158441 RepID=UPI001604E152|nr:uncharacterized protein LOC110862662 isoform X2 [Folsomia candida]
MATSLRHNACTNLRDLVYESCIGHGSFGPVLKAIDPSKKNFMELCGENLRSWLNEEHDIRNQDVQHTQLVIIQNLVSGLKHLHENKILHRDLKPENVMFSKQGFILPVRIGDYGPTRILKSMNWKTGRHTSRVGTSEHMAPESNIKPAQCHDLYSLGLVIWEVAQLIRFNERTDMFSGLVNGKKETLVREHPTIEGARPLIIALTKKEVTERLQNIRHVFSITYSWKFAHFSKCITDFELETWQGDALLASGFHRLLNVARKYVVKNAWELRDCLKNVTTDCTITLKTGEYQGDFTLRGDNITITGEEDEAGDCPCIAFKGRLLVIGSDNNICMLDGNQISDISIDGDRNHINYVRILNNNANFRMYIKGNTNVIENIEVESCNNFLLEIEGYQNIFDGFFIDSGVLASIIMFKKSEKNILSNINILDSGYSIVCQGQNNRFLNVTVELDTIKPASFILSSPYNIIDNFNCLPKERGKIEVGSDNSSVLHSSCENIMVNGKNVNLTDVDANALQLGKMLQTSVYSEVELDC